MAYPATIERLIQELVKLPGIGRRSAERVVFHFLNSPSKEDISLLAQRLLELKERVRLCQRCHNLSEQDECTICMNETRNKSILCVVERPNDVTSIEKTGTFNGVYHVLLGSIAPLDGKGPAELKIDSLMQRIKNEHIEEVIIATDSDTEGETTALYLSKLIKPLEVRLSRIGLGLPVGSNLEYADSATLSKALESRRAL
ncbi:MAG: recombination protein RecR [Omnitrophica WOR_2 bacterium GWF2_43_52]|nr:MAG: recombination protein RecR [Omnitrophica WOR_2 bacterium GWF2_43_52]OGX57239.1 MAG: recombination protein RecR [Omnitrophica WOR_2 bacterium RIFOXYC2_FULL_43_9]HAH21365.1 recombination protein RecR [Candidatus Omnitrophota bacterium]HBG63984.1 recombination protein RecR [Candidatus Omnitrophota bacterium]